MSRYFCRECLAEIPPSARTGCCEACRPVRRHSEERARRVADSHRRREANRPPHYLT
jgi:hypothetical protein